MTTLGSVAKRMDDGAGEGVPGPSRGSCGDAAARGATDAALLIRRVGRELAELATMADEIQLTIGTHVGAAALADPAVMREAQRLDLLTQSLRALSSFLDGIAPHGIGDEALDFDGAASSIPVKALADRLAGRSATASTDDVELF